MFGDKLRFSSNDQNRVVFTHLLTNASNREYLPFEKSAACELKKYSSYLADENVSQEMVVTDFGASSGDFFAINFDEEDVFSHGMLDFFP